MKKWSWILGVVVSVWTPCVQAEGVRTAVKKGEISYDFEDDPLSATGDVAAGMRIHVRPVGKRTLLIRPRAQFIREMLLSVEDL